MTQGSEDKTNWTKRVTKDVFDTSKDVGSKTRTITRLYTTKKRKRGT